MAAGQRASGDSPTELVAALQTLCSLAGLTRRQLASKAALEERRVGDWLRGDHVPSRENLHRVLRVLIRVIAEGGKHVLPDIAVLLDDSETGPWWAWHDIAAAHKRDSTLAGRDPGDIVLRIDQGTVELHHHYPGALSVPAAARHRVGMLPPRADGFQGRVELGQVAEVVASNTSAVQRGVGSSILSGLGGVGKTQLAAEHARILWDRGDIDILVWVEATSRQGIVSGYASAATEVLGVSSVDADRAAARWLDWLAGTELRWLVVLDDLQDPTHVRGLWPPHTRTGRIVATTRRREAALDGDGRCVIEIGLFTSAEATAFLTQRLARRPRQSEGAVALAEALGHLPLALAQAAAYIADDPALTCATYLPKFIHSRSLADVLPDPSGLPDDHQTTVAATWSLSIQAANDLRPKGLARPILSLAALLDPNGIPHSIFTTSATCAYLSDITGRRVDADTAVSALSCLHRLSLITYTPDAPHHAVRVHALVQRAVRETLIHDDRLTIVAHAAADALMHAWPNTDRDPTLAAVLRSNTSILTTVTGDLLWQRAVHPVVLRAGDSVGESGQMAAAVGYFRELAASAGHHLGSGHPDSLRIRSHLAFWRGWAGDPAGAAADLKALLSDQLQNRDPDYPDILVTREDIAFWQGQAGDAAGAGAEFAKLLPENLRVHGPDHPNTLICRHNIAYWRGQAGDAASAVGDFETLLTDRLRVLGPDHLNTLSTRHEIAFWRGHAGEAADAVVDFQALLTDRLRVQGPDHPNTLLNRHEIAFWRGQAGDGRGAIDALQALLPDRLRVLGPDHPHTLTTQHDIAYFQAETGDPVGATTALNVVLTDRLRVLGADHPDTLTTRRTLARCQGQAGDPVGATATLEALLADSLRILGTQHRITMGIRSELAYWQHAATNIN